MLHDIRCEKCGTLLCKEDIEIGEVEIKCYRCNHYNRLEWDSKIVESILTAALA